MHGKRIREQWARRKMIRRKFYIARNRGKQIKINDTVPLKILARTH